MQLPDDLRQAIEQELDKVGLKSITEARQELTERYRSGQKKGEFIATEAHRLAYLITRLPATYAAICTVLGEIKRLMPDLPIRSLLDLGSGPGTAMWASIETFPNLGQITLIEKNINLMALGKRLASHSPFEVLRDAAWSLGDLEHIETLPKQDLVILSYSIGEVKESARKALLDKCWDSAESALVVIEPGTPAGFERIRDIRRHLIAKGCHMIAPCPHAVACPMPQGDWCHFAARIERTSLHRRMKGGSLGHEDEKFSYIAVSKVPCSLPMARVLRHPLKRSGHTCLTLCTSDGVKQETVSKKDPELYKLVRKIEWGSPYPN